MLFGFPPEWRSASSESAAIVEPEVRLEARVHFRNASKARSFLETRSLFAELEEAVPAYFYEEHFHNQLKARLLKDMVLTQVVVESTLANVGKLGEEGVDARDVRRQSEIAWNLSTGVFYKVGGRPWKVASIREGVCYVGLAFKKDETEGNQRNACCAAQMFLDSGDGMVFKGAVGALVQRGYGRLPPQPIRRQRARSARHQVLQGQV